MPETRNQGQSAGQQISDVDRLKDCLCDAKARAKLYASAALEATNNGVREFFLAMQGEETHNQEILFSFLHTRGFYPVEMAPEERIRQVAQQFRTIHDQLGLTEDPSFRKYETADPNMPPAHATNPQRFEYKQTH